MSEFNVTVVRLGKIGKHPNADRLSVTQVRGNYPVVMQTESFKPGDLAVHIPPDAIVDTTRNEFSFLASKATNDRFRVRFAKLRGVPSYGFLIPAPEGAVEGQDCKELLGIQKYDPGPCYQLGGEIAGEHFRIPKEGVVPQYDIEGIRKFEDLLVPGESVTITEKIHGSNGRWVYLDDELNCGSRTRWRKNSVWNVMAEKYDLERILKDTPGLVLYGEVYGQKIQDLTYGIVGQAVSFFDVYDSTKGEWWNTDQFIAFCKEHGLPTVPILYRGKFNLQTVYELSEGLTRLSACHVREGVVVKPDVERFDQACGRVFLKCVGQGYLLRKTA